MERAPSLPVEIGLSAAIAALGGTDPLILTAAQPSPGARSGLPYGPFDPQRHRTFETALRSWVHEQTGLELGYVEQLYTFGDRGRHAEIGQAAPHIVSVGYLALTRRPARGNDDASDEYWRSWYRFLPWEDWRGGRPAQIEEVLVPALERWAQDDAPSPLSRRHAPRRARLRLAFGLDGVAWDEERALERYELLYEAGLVEEAVTDGRAASTGLDGSMGIAMAFDHRRILATAMSRLRAKLKYRPVIFEMMPDEFTLTDLQHAVEAISGRHLHKQNFRRLVESADLVEPTGGKTASGIGRPAQLYRFRRSVLMERPAPGLRVGRS